MGVVNHFIYQKLLFYINYEEFKFDLAFEDVNTAHGFILTMRNLNQCSHRRSILFRLVLY